MTELSELEFRFEWEDPAGARGAELRATWARLDILVGGRSITRLIDDTSRSVRTSVYLPLYPLAEWLATHWWFLGYEPEVPGRPAALGFGRRHSLRHAGEGYALPDVSVRALGDIVRLDWQPTRLETQRVEFTDSGSVHVTLKSFQAAVRDLVVAVLRRLEDAGLPDTPLAEEWRAIDGADADEAAFCVTAAALGADPYALDDASRGAIVRAHDAMPPSLAPDFFPVAEVGALAEQVRLVLDALHDARARASELSQLRLLKEQLRPAAAGAGPPWEEGHRFAQRVRQHLGLDGTILDTFESIASALRVGSPTLSGPTVASVLGQPIFDALVAADEDRDPSFVLDARRLEAQRFAFCRALFEYLAGPGEQPHLVTRARSANQQRNRAFAAEFLAPVDMLRARVSGSVLGEEDVDEIAATLGVSPFVVRHQLVNYEVATIRTA